MDPTTTDVRRRRTSCGRKEAGLEHVDRANHRLRAAAPCSSSSSSGSHAALRQAVARLGSPYDGLAPDANVAEAPNAPRPDAGMGSPAAAAVRPGFLAPPLHEGASSVYADPWDSLHGNAHGTEISCSTCARCHAVPSLCAPLPGASAGEQEPTRFAAPATSTTIK